jgi:hypothetical protein
MLNYHYLLRELFLLVIILPTAYFYCTVYIIIVLYLINILILETCEGADAVDRTRKLTRGIVN